MSGDAPTGPPDVGSARERRLPPGQYRTDKWPVLHWGSVPRLEPDAWTVRLDGQVEEPRTLTWSELMDLPQREVLCDIHCVTQWSRFDNRFEGIPVRELAALVRPAIDASHALVHATEGWSANLPLEDLLREEVLLAHSHDGEPLEPEHGGPLRLVVPHLYFWKSAKWVTGIEFLPADEPGFWERNGYHMRGDPWREERFGW